jgi:hypothetical protein
LEQGLTSRTMGSDKQAENAKVTTAKRSETSVLSSGEISIVSSYGSLFALARRACDRAKQNEQEALVAVVFSALAIEGFVNHMILMGSYLSEDPPHEEIRALASIMKDIEDQKGTSLGLKIQMAFYILTRRGLDCGSLPYQDFSLLVDLRNQLVHSRPEKVEWPPRTDWEPHRLVQRLVLRKVMPKPPGGQAPQFQAVVCRYDIARWAYNVGVEMMNFLTDAVPDSRLKQVLRSSASNFPPIGTEGDEGV